MGDPTFFAIPGLNASSFTVEDGADGGVLLISVTVIAVALSLCLCGAICLSPSVQASEALLPIAAPPS